MDKITEAYDDNGNVTKMQVQDEPNVSDGSGASLVSKQDISPTPVVETSNEKIRVPQINISKEGVIELHLRNEDEFIALAGAKTIEAANGIVVSSMNALGQRSNIYSQLAVSMLVELEPKDAIESMLVCQMTATHVAIAEWSARSINAENAELRDKYNIMVNRLNRTFCTQVETLKKYRAKATQTVRVERVEVSEGGQAIVGHVSQLAQGQPKQ
ncbi:MAG: hypothetical protein ABJ327_17930 [Litoreibacter sp.]